MYGTKLNASRVYSWGKFAYRRVHGSFLIYLKEIGTEDMDLILLAQETVKWRAALNM
jgi:uncharacterized membrane protein